MTFIKKINTYLLEHYPTIWNTRLVWMLGVAIITHLFFFVIGYFTVENQIDIESEYRLSSFYYGTAVVFFNVLLSIIVLLIWIIYYLQNNAFKNLYTIKKGTLSAQLCIVVVIFFTNITQYYSFNKGLKLKIRNLYSWEEIDSDIKEFNKTAIFLIQNKQDYDLNNKKFPGYFPLKHITTNSKFQEDFYKKIDTTKSYFKFKGIYYQFYKVNQNLLRQEGIEEDDGRIYNNDNLGLDFKYRKVKDVTAFKEDVENCLFNYSKELFIYGQDSVAYMTQLKHNEEVLKRANEREIKKELQSFLGLAKKYNIQHNLNIEEWYYLLDENNYNYTKDLIEKNNLGYTYKIHKNEKERKNYPITQYILLYKPNEYNNNENKRNYIKTIEVENNIIEETKKYTFKKGTILPSVTYSKYTEVKFSEAPYCDFGNLDRFFKNTYGAYQPDDHKEPIYFYIIISLFFSLLLFLFKITDIKTLLLSFVATALVLIIVGLLITNMPFAIKSYLGTNTAQYLIAVIAGLGVITSSILALKLKWKKLITAILFSLAIFAIPLTLMFVILMYNDFLSYDYRLKDPFSQWIKKNIFWVILIIWGVTLAFYTKAIRKWKGLPE